jgi:uncharacterized protein (DUF169 family)
MKIRKNGRINMGKYKETDDKLNTYLRLATFPVAVKLLRNPEELNEIKFLKKTEKKISRNISWI